MPSGYWNKVLRIDLTHAEVCVETVDERVWRQTIGGAGYGAKVLLDETEPHQEPLGPGNKLVFATGPFQGTGVPGSAKWSVSGISPLTGTYADSAAGAGWGVALKRAGYDALIVEGASAEPMLLSITEERVQLLPGADFWGLDSYETLDAVRSRLGDERASVACIGPAGESKVALACIVADGHSFAGRCGLGAVMGAKNLKAVAIRGTKRVPVAAPVRLKELMTQEARAIAKTAGNNGFRDHGTPNLCILAESLGDMPIKYWNGDTWPEGARSIGAPNYTQVLNASPLPCPGCPVGCHRRISVVEPARYATKGPGPEYETLGMLGSNLLVDDVKAIAKANDVCNRLGVDTISTGACIGLAMEAFERGWITEKDTGGLALRWGDGSIVVRLCELMGRAEGFGAWFARGSAAAAERMHPDAPGIVCQVKGLDLPAHDARACFTLAVNYATSTRGACHMRGVTEDVDMGAFTIPELGISQEMTPFFQPEGKALVTARLQDLCAFVNSSVLCVFMLDGGGLSLTAMTEMFNATTGWDWSIDDVMAAGARIMTMQRLVNVRDGHSRTTDILPFKMRQPARGGFRAGMNPGEGFEERLQELYALHGWDTNGLPSRETLGKLGLEQYARLVSSGSGV